MMIEIQDTRHSIASTAEMVVHFIEREEARHLAERLKERL